MALGDRDVVESGDSIGGDTRWVDVESISIDAGRGQVGKWYLWEIFYILRSKSGASPLILPTMTSYLHQAPLVGLQSDAKQNIGITIEDALGNGMYGIFLAFGVNC
jgi:hypothetical protein